MPRNLKTKLWLGVPINFHEICSIYPLTVGECLCYMDVPDNSQDQLSFNGLFLPYTINDVFLKEFCPDFHGTVWDYWFVNVAQAARLCYTLAVFTHEINLEPDLEHKRVVFNKGSENERSLGPEHFDEFADIILQAHYMKKYKPDKQKKIRIKNPEYQKRYQQYQARRQKNPQVDDDNDLAVCVKYIQVASQSYIPDKEILSWSYWKLLRWHSELIRQVEYQNGYQCYATCGDKKLRKALTKLETELRTKI